MSMQEERSGRAMRRTRDERQKRPTRRSKERVADRDQRPSRTTEPEVPEVLPFDYTATAQVCKNFLRHILQPARSDESQPPTYNCTLFGITTVYEFIRATLRNTRFPECVAFAALLLLHRLKRSGVALDVNDAHRLFLCAYMIAAKVHVDETFCNAYWVILGDRHFKTAELNRCERELCGMLHWNLLVDPLVLETFTEAVKRDFREDGPYPDYPLDEDLSDPEKRFPQLPDKPAVQDEEEPVLIKPPVVPPRAVVAALARHRRPMDIVQPSLLEPQGLECETSVTSCATSDSARSMEERRPGFRLPSCKEQSATWLPLAVLRASGYVMNSCNPV
ncbi:uncharacterized protein C8Q71DRAFT_8012 [Rhodofomes roseus]|uniref:Cyclin N-terminal domain-containing protein n=1 Tax=Rhodofomes roseus TaxID=34475 RepID=A0ABQ8KXZ8_9APHY|nr:uncharacterized protein C8Q71DRAFT_8012 [Rhodofomes roseus]KAH9843636.1 hypothetical protein C8Q71DRAFT_8012 [Rhodofomes roseus]